MNHEGSTTRVKPSFFRHSVRYSRKHVESAEGFWENRKGFRFPRIVLNRVRNERTRNG
jgi:hypothetical protein